MIIALCCQRADAAADVTPCRCRDCGRYAFALMMPLPLILGFSFIGFATLSDAFAASRFITYAVAARIDIYDATLSLRSATMPMPLRHDATPRRRC